jgi:hypothetical protein
MKADLAASPAKQRVPCSTGTPLMICISSYYQAHCGLGPQGLVVFILISKYCSVVFYGKYFYAHSCTCFWHEKKTKINLAFK